MLRAERGMGMILSVHLVVQGIGKGQMSRKSHLVASDGCS